MAFIYSFTRHESTQVFIAAAAGIVITIITWPRNFS